MSSDDPTWVQTEDNWDGYGAKATLPAVIEAVERHRPIWEAFGLSVIPYQDRAMAENFEDSVEWRADGSCPIFDRIAELEAENDKLTRCPGCKEHIEPYTLHYCPGPDLGRNRRAWISGVRTWPDE